MTTPDLLPIEYRAPLVNPSPSGLFAATTWTDDEIPRWLAGSVRIRWHNYSARMRSASGQPTGAAILILTS